MGIQEALDNILKSIFGKDVRQSIHDGIKSMNDQVVKYTNKQDALDKKYDNLLDELSKSDPSLAEVVDARTNEAGEVYPSLKQRLDTADKKVKNLDEFKNTIFDRIYPVGSVYISINSMNPGTIFGGTWESFASGKTLVGVNADDGDFNTVEKTGGNKTHLHSTANHTLTINEMPKHNHGYMRDQTMEDKHISVGGTNNPAGSAIENLFVQSGEDGTAQAGGGAAHNHGNTGSTSNLQPYITCYIWKRTA